MQTQQERATQERATRPHGYPVSPSAVIYDADAFTIGKGVVWHRPRFFAGVQVIAWCGVYGFSDYFGVYPDDWQGQDYSTRPALYGGADDLPLCAACVGAGGRAHA